MKLKSKLIMSGVALAACAATLTSTTYAWYTSNTEVTATGITSASATSGSDLLLISKTGKEGSWSNTVAYESTDTGIEDVSLLPVAYHAGSDTTTQGTFKGWSQTAESSSDAATTNYLTVTTYLKATTAVTVYVNGFTITNETSSLPQKDILASAGGLEANDSTKTYTVDVLRTLQFEQTVETVSAGTITATSVALYDYDTLAGDPNDSLKGKTAGTGFNAHTYYNAVTGNTIADDSEGTSGTKIKSSGNTKWTLGTTPVAAAAGDLTYLKVTFKIFINGWDYACFDACQGQAISVGLKFSTLDNASGMLYTA